MRILHAAAEIYPIVRTGGLGDVLAALPKAQRAAGLDARIVMPAYPAVKARLQGLETVAWLGQLFGSPRVSLLKGIVPDGQVPAYAIDAPGLFDRPGSPYLAPGGVDWADNAIRFGLLSWAAAQIARGLLDPDWRAEICQAHDWHAGLVPAYLAFADDERPKPASILTIHNLAFQGLFAPDAVGPLGLPPSAFHPGGFEFWGKLSFMKAGLVYADRVTTVSPGYAREIATVEYGCGLEGVIAGRGGDVRGILNGVDEGVWDPATDPNLPAHYEAGDLAPRAEDRAALLAEFGLEPPAGPLFGVVSRLTHQKGLDLLLDALPSLLARGGALALLGSEDPVLEAGFLAAARVHPGRIGVRIGYDDRLSRRIFAGSDAILVPSRFEPCGLTQLYALRYGAVPVVRRTGGLGDTVADATPEAIAAGTATGFLFDAATASDLAGALDRASAAYRDPVLWRKLQAAGMACRFSWDVAAASYAELYAELSPPSAAAPPASRSKSGSRRRPPA
ncbi:MAG TPA: glycogen synthase GlgA [Aliidongia sp.]|nr:glycogen synthase GlgA [Aliidongia sp.]